MMIAHLIAFRASLWLQDLQVRKGFPDFESSFCGQFDDLRRLRYYERHLLKTAISSDRRVEDLGAVNYCSSCLKHPDSSRLN